MRLETACSKSARRALRPDTSSASGDGADADKALLVVVDVAAPPPLAEWEVSEVGEAVSRKTGGGGGSLA